MVDTVLPIFSYISTFAPAQGSTTKTIGYPYIYSTDLKKISAIPLEKVQDNSLLFRFYDVIWPDQIGDVYLFGANNKAFLNPTNQLSILQYPRIELDSPNKTFIYTTKFTPKKQFTQQEWDSMKQQIEDTDGDPSQRQTALNATVGRSDYFSYQMIYGTIGAGIINFNTLDLSPSIEYSATAPPGDNNELTDIVIAFSNESQSLNHIINPNLSVVATNLWDATVWPAVISAAGCPSPCPSGQTCKDIGNGSFGCQTSTNPPPDPDNDPDDPPTDKSWLQKYWWVILLIIIAVALVIIIALVVSRKKKKPVEPAKPVKHSIKDSTVHVYT